MGALGFSDLHGLSILIASGQGSEARIRFWHGEYHWIHRGITCAAAYGDFLRLGDEIAWWSWMEISPLHVVHNLLSGGDSHCVLHVYPVHSLISPTPTPPDRNWFRLPFAIMTAIVVTLQLAAYIKTVNGKRLIRSRIPANN